jgi:chorismate mutase/prephenate dehydratase
MPGLMADPTDPEVARQRAAIDAADLAILAALNRRIEAVRRLHDHKVARGYPLSDPGREAAIVAALRAANEGPVADEAIPDVVAAVLALTRSEVARLRGQDWA